MKTRTVDIWVTLEMPEALRDLVKDVTLSFRSQGAPPWSDTVRRVGTDDMFGVRMRVPADGNFLLHAVATVDEPGEGGAEKRHLWFANLFIDASEARVTLSVSLFENYSLIKTSEPFLVPVAA